MDKATMAFHQEHRPSPSQLAIQGLNDPFGNNQEANRAMEQLIAYSEGLNEKYRHWIQEYKDMKTKLLTSRTCSQMQEQTRNNLEYIITTESSRAKKTLKRKIHNTLQPHADRATKHQRHPQPTPTENTNIPAHHQQCLPRKTQRSD
jgi:hypothetical protein